MTGRIYHPYTEWEEIRFNMWGESKDKKRDLERAILFTGNHRLYGKYMFRVIREWPVSCENALSNKAIARKSWVGHAAVALALKIPEHVVRQAWGHLTESQRIKANEQASNAIREWRRLQGEDTDSHQNLGTQMLLQRTSRVSASSA